MAIEGRITTDVFVLGGGLSGVAAALGAAHSGAEVVLCERHYLLGGAATEALVCPLQTFHSRTGRVIGGVAQELIDRLQARDGSPGHLPDPVGFAASVTPADPDVLKSTLAEWTDEENIKLLFGHHLREVSVSGGRVTHVVVEDENENYFEVEASIYVDATGNGDLTAGAGCEMEIDPDCQPMTLIFTVGGVDASAIIKYQKNNPDEFHLNPDLSVLDRGYIAVSGFFRHVHQAHQSGLFNIQRDRLLFFGNTRPGEVVVNTTRISSYRGLYGDEISAAMREALYQVWEVFRLLRNEIPGFDRSRIVRIADHIGVRETRRLVGRYVMNEGDILTNTHFYDAIAKGGYPMDIHSAVDSSLATEMIGGSGHYDIPLRCLLNKQVENLITVGKCISVTHKGFSSTRVMPTCMAVGHAGGVAAALTAKTKKDPEELAPLIQDALRAQFAIIFDEDVVPETL
jgi:hypothetical protein